RDLEKINRGGVMALGIIIIAMIAVVIAAMLEQDDTKIDSQKEVYLFLHGRADLQERAETSLVAYGFQKEKITVASSENVGSVGDYIAMLWRPPRPDHIKIQKITKVKEVEPDKIIGFWRGVSGKVIDIIFLEKDKEKDSIHRSPDKRRRGQEGEKKRIHRPGLQDNQGFI
ncbi:MAG: hypothetical protein QGI15_04750, partial [Candidatus Scalindua sp.]|nr:hypothetical protein [Candidatus Scalindua sp.]